MSLYYGKNRKERLRDKEYENAGGDLANESFRFSTSYHSFFAGYAEYRVPRKNGRGTRIERIYVAPYYEQDVSDARWMQYKVVYLSLYAAAVLSYLTGALNPDAIGNRTVWAAIPGLLSAFALFIELTLLVETITRKRKMTIGEYQSGPVRLDYWSAIAAALLVVTAAAGIVCAVITDTNIVEGLTSGLLTAVSAGAVWMLHKLENDMSYRRVPNDAKPQSDDYVLI
jgi:hypothetical protein